MKKTIKHIILPAILPAIFFLVASIPVGLIGCRNRGLIAVLLAIVAVMLGIVAAVKAVIGKVRRDANSSLWIATALILAIPAILIVFNAV